MIHSHIGALTLEAQKVARHSQAALEDLIAEGMIGLLIAFHRFDPERGIKFISYGAWWMRVLMQRFAYERDRLVALPHSAKSRTILQALRDGRLDALKERDVQAYRQWLSPIIRLDEPLRANGHQTDSQTTLLDTLPDDNARSPEELAIVGEGGDAREAVRMAVRRLSPREQEVVSRRILAEEPETLEKIGSEWRVSRERVRQIEVAAKANLRKMLTRDLLKEI